MSDAQELMNGPRGIAERKAEVVAELTPLWAAQREQRRRERECYRTKPRGHIFGDSSSPGEHECRVCGKRRSAF